MSYGDWSVPESWGKTNTGSDPRQARFGGSGGNGHRLADEPVSKRMSGTEDELYATSEEAERKAERHNKRAAAALGFDVKKRDERERNGQRAAGYAAGAAGAVGAGVAGNEISNYRIVSQMQRGNQMAAGDHGKGLRAKYSHHPGMDAEDMKFAMNHWNKARRAQLHGRLSLVAGATGGAGLAAAALHHAHGSKVKKSAQGDLYRQATELDRAGRREAKANAVVVDKPRRKPHGPNWDPESGRQRRVGAAAGVALLGGGLLAASGVRGGLRSGGAARRVLAGAVKPSGPKANNQLLDADDVAHARRLTSGKLRPVVISAKDASKIVGGASLVGAGVSTAQYGRSQSNRRWN